MRLNYNKSTPLIYLLHCHKMYEKDGFNSMLNLFRCFLVPDSLARPCMLNRPSGRFSMNVEITTACGHGLHFIIDSNRHISRTSEANFGLSRSQAKRVHATGASELTLQEFGLSI